MTRPSDPSQPRPKVVGGRLPTPTIWQRAGVLVGYLQTDPVEVAHRCLEHGFAWVAPKCHDGLNVEPGVGGWVQAFRQAVPSVLVLGWGVQQYEPVEEAKVAANLCRDLGLIGYIADAEGPYKTDYRMADGTTGVRSRAARFVTEFRHQQPTLPAVLTTFGAGAQKPDGAYWQLGDVRNADAGVMDWKSFYDARFRFLPQAYPNESGPVYSVPNCISHAVQCGWPRSQVHPMLGCYPSRFPYDPTQYARELEAGRTVGFLVFLADEMSSEDWTVLGAAIKAGKVAR